MSAGAVHADCGTPLPQWPPFGPIVSIRDDDAAKLVEFYRGQLDQLKCEGCGRALSPAPSLVVSFNEYALEYLYCGPAAKERPEVVRELEEDAKAKGNLVLAGGDSPDELRSIAWGILEARAAAFYRALNVVLTEAGDEAWGAAWPEVTSSACAALLASRMVGLPVRLDLALNDSVRSFSQERISRGFQEVQARTWISMCERWVLPHPPATTLEQDLTKYLATSAVIGGAPDLFFKHIASLDLEKLNAGVKHAYFAAEATLRWLLETPNPHADKWALSYLALETLRPPRPPEQAAALAALSISEQRLRNTVERQSLARSVSQWMSRGVTDANEQNAVQEAVTKAGHPDLLGAAYAAAKLVPQGGGELPIDQVAVLMRAGLESYSTQPVELEVWLDLMRQSLPTISAEDLVSLARDLEKPYVDNPITLAIIRSWLGRILCMRREPQPFLDHVGAEPEAWESITPLDLKSILWLWRARALRVTARPSPAFELLKKLVEPDREAFAKLKPHIRQLVLGDLALSYMDLGYPETALDMLTGLLNDPTVKRTPWLLRAAANVYTRLGRHSEAIALLREGLTTAVQPDMELRPVLHAELAYALSLQGQEGEAREWLSRIPEDAISNPEVFVSYSAALLNLGFDEPSEGKQGHFLAIAKRAGEMALDSLKNNDIHLHLTSCRLAAAITGQAGNLGIWELLEAHSRDFEGSPDPEALLVLALRDWERGEIEGARRRLIEFPNSLAQRHADTRDVSAFIHALKQLSSKLNLLGDLLTRAAVPDANARFVGELQRDLLGRIAARSLAESASGFVVPDDEAVRRLGCDAQTVGVLEWISGTGDVRWLLTILNEKGRVQTCWLDPPELDMPKLRDKIHQRLQTWHLGRAGDPFELPAWQSFETWLRQVLDARLSEGGTLVVIEHSTLSGIPWHVAAAPRWRTSYVPSWSALLRARDTARQVESHVLGLAMVAKFNESQSNVEALEESTVRTERLATSVGWELQSGLREQCDREALLRVLESSSVAKIMCHGFVSAADNVVALTLAHDGRVPVADSMSAAAASNQGNRFDWRDCRQLNRAPNVVLSAACSSGRSHLAGIGERLGLYSILRAFGTRSLIAPRWDLKHLDLTLPILDRTVERYLRDGEGLGSALHGACVEAEQQHARWLAWTFSLEGDWE
jgi:tetratricopeptide (TPR) repeat protein